MRYREEKHEDLDRVRDTVREWRAASPDGAPDEMLAAVGGQFRPDYAPLLRAVLFRTDLRDAKVTTGITIIAGDGHATGAAGASR